MRILYSLKECRQTDGWVGLLGLCPFQHAARAVACAPIVWHVERALFQLLPACWRLSTS